METGIVREMAENVLNPTEGERRFIAAVATLADLALATRFDLHHWQRELPAILDGLAADGWSELWYAAFDRLQEMADLAGKFVADGDWTKSAAKAIRIARKRREFWSDDDAGNYYVCLDDVIGAAGYRDRRELVDANDLMRLAHDGLLDPATHHAWSGWLLQRAAALETADTAEANRLAADTPDAPVAV